MHGNEANSEVAAKFVQLRDAYKYARNIAVVVCKVIFSSHPQVFIDFLTIIIINN